MLLWILILFFIATIIISVLKDASIINEWSSWPGWITGVIVLIIGGILSLFLGIVTGTSTQKTVEHDLVKLTTQVPTENDVYLTSTMVGDTRKISFAYRTGEDAYKILDVTTEDTKIVEKVDITPYVATVYNLNDYNTLFWPAGNWDHVDKRTFYVTEGSVIQNYAPIAVPKRKSD